MTTENVTVATYAKHTSAEKAVEALKAAKFDLKTVSIVGRGFHTDEHIVGYYTTGDRMLYWGKNGAFWGGLWGLLFGSALFVIPGFGPLLAAGPIVAWIVGAMESAVVIGGASAIGAGLYSIGIPEDSVLRYETSLKAGHFVLVVHGTPDEVGRAKTILGGTGATDTRTHLAPAPVAVPA